MGAHRAQSARGLVHEGGDAMPQAVSKSRSRKVNGYVKAVLALETVRQRRQERYDRFVRPLDRKRDELEAEVAARMRALSGGQHAEAQRILAAATRRYSPDPSASAPSIAR
jgi:C4-dicarboxylate-specific signal transduction histidine kinase